jgi:hypothetical protein
MGFDFASETGAITKNSSVAGRMDEGNDGIRSRGGCQNSIRSEAMPGHELSRGVAFPYGAYWFCLDSLAIRWYYGMEYVLFDQGPSGVICSQLL